MRYVVLGAGAIGAGVGGLLHLAGHDVTLVARGAHREALADDGLHLQVGHSHHHLRVPVVGRPAEASWDAETVLLLAVKSHQTEAALADLLPVMPAGTPVFCLQNGVSNERTVLRHVEHVHGVVVMLPASHLAPGRVTVHSAGVPALLDLGSYPGGHDDVDDAVAADLVGAGMESVPRDDVMAWKYRKLLMNLGNAVDAACVEDEDADALVALAREEGERVLRAAGIAVVSESDDLRRRDDLLRPLVDRDGIGGSTWQSVQRGTGDVEVDHLNGEIVLLGRLHGVPTPANELARQALLTLVRSDGPARSVAAGPLLAQLAAGGQSASS